MFIKMLLPTVVLVQFLHSAVAVQSWAEQPRYQEVNPHGNVVLACMVNDMKGACRWEKDGSPIGLEPNKYELAAGSTENGDCSLKIIGAELQYDDGVWQCQVESSSYRVKDALISEGAQLVVRESPSDISLRRVGDEGLDITAKAGEEIDLECVVTGGNPPAKLRWFARDTEIQSGHRQDDRRSPNDARTWVSVSRLTLPVSKADNGATIRCLAEHPTLETPISAKAMLTIHYPPSVSIETSQLDYLEEEKDPLTLRCISDSNPPASVIWRKEGLEGILSPDSEINFSPVTRHTAGLYSCTAENGIGRSKAAWVEVDVKYSPSILTVGPSQIVEAQMNDQAVLSCEADSNPPPRYQWLQKLPSNEVLIRGYDKQLVIQNVTYDHQGQFVCKAMNELQGEERSVQSEAITVKVRGRPQVMKYSASHEIRVQDGEDAVLKVLFCADPKPKESWHLSDPLVGSGNNIILAAGTRHGRFEVERTHNVTDRQDCYVTSLRIHGAHAGDSHGYRLSLSNSHGTEGHTVHLLVKDHIPRDYLIGAIVGAVLLFLTLILLCIWICKSGCCCCTSNESKKNFKPTDMESEKTDVESTHSSNMSSFPGDNKPNNSHVVIPPDALYATSEKHHSYAQQQQHYVQHQEAMFNDSKESLRPDLMSRGVHTPSALTPNSAITNLNRTSSTSGELNTSVQKVSYNDLCFPKTSNYGSMKKKKHHVGVDCRLSQQQQQQRRHFYP